MLKRHVLTPEILTCAGWESQGPVHTWDVGNGAWPGWTLESINLDVSYVTWKAISP